MGAASSAAEQVCFTRGYVAAQTQPNELLAWRKQILPKTAPPPDPAQRQPATENAHQVPRATAAQRVATRRRARDRF